VRLNSCLFGLRENREARLLNSRSKKAAAVHCQKLKLAGTNLTCSPESLRLANVQRFSGPKPQLRIRLVFRYESFISHVLVEDADLEANVYSLILIAVPRDETVFALSCRDCPNYNETGSIPWVLGVA